MSSASTKEFVISANEAMKARFCMMDLDECLLPDDDPYVVEHIETQRRAAEARLQGAGSSSSHPRSRSPVQGAGVPKWVGKHMALGSGEVCRSHWSEVRLWQQYPSFVNLPNRCKDLLDIEGMHFPENVKRIVNVSQSKAPKMEPSSSTHPAPVLLEQI